VTFVERMLFPVMKRSQKVLRQYVAYEGRPSLNTYPPHGIFVVVASSLLLDIEPSRIISVNREQRCKEEERCLDRGESRVFNMVCKIVSTDVFPL